MVSLDWKKIVMASAMTAAATLFAANPAYAGWGSSGGSWGSSGGSSGSSGGSWGSSGGSSGGYVVRHGGSWGSSGGSSGGYWRAHRWKRVHVRRSYYSSGSSGGSWGSSGGSSGGAYYGSNGSSGGSSGGVHYSTPVEVQATPSDTPVAPSVPQANATDADSVMLSIDVPAEAKVFINGAATTSAGEQRVYISKGLNPGKRYRYTIRAEIERDGKSVVKEESVVVTAGQQSQLALNFDSASENVAEKNDTQDGNPHTTLKVNVPEDAKVSVSGIDTHQHGSVRTFHTDQLAAGQTWDGYTVKAVVMRDGSPLELTRQVTLHGGDSQELTFDFESAELASRVSQSAR